MGCTVTPHVDLVSPAMIDMMTLWYANVLRITGPFLRRVSPTASPDKGQVMRNFNVSFIVILNKHLRCRLFNWNAIAAMWRSDG